MNDSLPSDLPPLEFGDVLLYDTPDDLFDRIIHLDGGADVAHVEVYTGNNQSFASRNGIGVNFYPIRFKGLKYVMRPEAVEMLFERDSAMNWAESVKGEGYDWLGLGQTVGIDLHEINHLFCSAAEVLFFRNGKYPIFSGYLSPEKFTPFDNRKSPNLEQIWPKI